MTSQLPETITVAKTIPDQINNAHIVGDSRIDEQGRWILGLGLVEQSGHRDLDLLEGDEFEFAGATWRVAKVYEPTTAARGSVAKLIRVSQSGG